LSSPRLLPSRPNWRVAGSPSLVAWFVGLPWCVHAAVVTLSAVGVRPLATRAGCIAIALGSIAFAFWFARTLDSSSRPDGAVTEPDAALPRLVSAQCVVLQAVAVLVTAASVVIAFVLPVIAYDALAYRLPALAQWLDAGRIGFVVTDDAVRNGYPLGQEAVSAVLVRAMGTMHVASVTSFFYVVGGALAIVLVAERSGIRGRLAHTAGALFLLVPMVVLNAPSGYVDAAFGGAVVAFVCATALLGPGNLGTSWFAFVGMAGANVLALKGNGLAFFAVVSGLTAVRVFPLRPAPKGVFAALAFALPGAFWTLRNVARFGNPVWPVEVKLAGHVLFHGVTTMDAVLDVAHNTPSSLVPLGGAGRVLTTWLQTSGPALDFDDRLAGLGWAWCLFALPSICFVTAVALRPPRRLRGVERASLVVLSCALCFALQPMKWWPRYTIWLWGAGAFSLAVVGERLAASKRALALTLGLGALTALSMTEALIAVAHAKSVNVAFAARSTHVGSVADARDAVNAASWVENDFWRESFTTARTVCRGAWKPGTDDPNLDGVFAQLTPRPVVRLIPDDDGNWQDVRDAWQREGCSALLLFAESPVLAEAARDPSVSVSRIMAFDPLFVVKVRPPRTTPAETP
jgi:hypothetical protein